VKYVDCITGGVTSPALENVLKAAIRYAPQPDWYLQHFELVPTKGGDYSVNFILVPLNSGEEEVFIETDGLSWGYGGEGPHGLATVLADLLIYYRQSTETNKTLRERIFRWVARQPQDQTQTVSAQELLSRLA
jgi:hypothetical protein